MDVLGNTLDLINEDFSKYLDIKEDSLQKGSGELKEQLKEQNSESIMTFEPKISNEDEVNSEGISSQKDKSEENIISTEVNLNVGSEEDFESPQKVSNITEDDNKAISENILSSLIREIEESMFPIRPIPQKEIHNNLNSKYSEKAVFHIKPIPKQMEEYEVCQENTDLIEDSDPSLDEVEGEIMMNFNLIRNFEMKRSRVEKNDYDNDIFSDYIKEVFDAIQSRSDLFLKAFSKPIQKDYLESLTKLHYHVIEDPIENLEDSMVDNLDDQASILTIDLYLSLEKKREEENEKIRNLVSQSDNQSDQILKEGQSNRSEESSFEIPQTKMPISLIKGHKKVNKEYTRNKLSLFAECEHIYNKALFDAINESLDIYRPHGKKGEPLPWTGKGAFIIDYTLTDIESDEVLK